LFAHKNSVDTFVADKFDSMVFATYKSIMDALVPEIVLKDAV
jgi:hypothetical protein